jgi:hypothetical protein
MHCDLLTAAKRDAIVAASLRSRCPQLGLKEISPRTWIDGSQPPVRRIFELQLLKGAAMKACWGFSLDFVPHIAAGNIRWHRSDKTAKLDVIIDLRRLGSASYLRGVGVLEADLNALLPKALSLAQRDWARGSTFAGMVDLIREIREQNLNCFGYHNYTQLPLAAAFLSAKVGDFRDAETKLDEYVRLHNLDGGIASKLKSLISAS